jgi:hypothetical protein
LPSSSVVVEVVAASEFPSEYTTFWTYLSSKQSNPSESLFLFMIKTLMLT